MHDEFRVRVDIGAGQERALLASLESLDLDDQDREVLGRVAVTHDFGQVFLYADSPDAAERAHRLAVDALAAGELQAEVSTWRWHHDEERWEDAAKPLPATEEERAAEHARLEAAEAQESQATGTPQWEVRINLPSLGEARRFAEQLESEGIPVLRRWRHLLVGANNEDQATALAERLRSEAPEGSELMVEGSGLTAAQAMESPFRMFGGMGV